MRDRMRSWERISAGAFFTAGLVLSATAITVHAVEGGDAQYVAIANRIIEKVALLKNEYPHFTEIDVTGKRNEFKDALGGSYVDFNYEHGVTLVPNPSYNNTSNIKTSHEREKPVYNESDGISLLIGFAIRGEFMHQEALPYETIGEMKVEVSVRGSDTEALSAIRKRIWEIVRGEKSAFENTQTGLQ